ncbi:class I SAM-dependent methyltransferase [Nocardioides litoris]|uniref:class I SAM-dependent methyltransferase n=1 Tax=Nocardioides litoris TaxID=1926648 RepID=UPI001476F4D7|nr:class I SAM-dependent methyltransferase [Nocardioides litoris]
MPSAKQNLHQLARRVGRQPTVRRVVQPAVGRFYAHRNKRRSATEVWADGATWESAHWDQQWLRDAHERGLLDPAQPLEDTFVVEAVDRLPADREPVTLLDVGAGPLTPLGKVHPRRALEITACDALADDYDAILADAGVTPPVRTVAAHGEQLAETFGEDTFDLVHCGNALDHHYDPIAALEGMLRVVKPGGAVLLNHYVNEGVFQNYLGMHQWNIEQRDGHTVIWNPSEVHDLEVLLEGRAAVTTSFRDGGDDRGRLETVVTKAA